MKKRFIIVFLICVLLVFIIYLFRKSPLKLEVAKVEKGPVIEFIEEDGKTRLAEKYTMNMPIDGRLLRIQFNIGNYIQKDQVVAIIDTYQIQQKIGGLKAELKEISAQIVGVDESKPKPEDIDSSRLEVDASRLKLKNSNKEVEISQIDYERQKRDYERLKELKADKIISQSDYEEAEQLFKNAQERLDQAKIQKELASRELEVSEAQYKRILNSMDDNEYQRKAYQARIQQIRTEINILEDSLKKTEIKSPVKGPIMEKFIEDEQVLQAGTPIMVIGDLSTIEIEVDVLSEEIGRVKAGQNVRISGRTLGDRTIEGVVKSIYPSGFKKISSLGIEQQRVKTLIAFDNSKIKLLPGLSVDVRIITAERQDVLRIPEKAIFQYENHWAVFVVNKDRVKIQEIGLGLKNEDNTEIVNGLSEGQLIVLSPPNALKSGMKIRPVF